MIDRTFDRRPTDAHHLIGDALDTLGRYVYSHRLYATTASVTPHGSRYDFDTDTDVDGLPGIRLELTPTEFLLWCEALNAPRIGVARRVGRTELSADVHRDDCSWRLTATISHTKGDDRLPGARVAWNRNETGRKLSDGYTTVADLWNALAAFGYRYETPAGNIVPVEPCGPTKPQIIRYGHSAFESPPGRTTPPCRAPTAGRRSRPAPARPCGPTTRPPARTARPSAAPTPDRRSPHDH